MDEFEIKWNFKTAKAKFTVDADLCCSSVPDDIPLPLFHAPNSEGDVGWVITIHPEELDFTVHTHAYGTLKFSLAAEGATCGNVIVCANIEVLQSDHTKYLAKYCEKHKGALTSESFSLSFDSGIYKYDTSVPLQVGQVAFMGTTSNSLTILATIKFCTMAHGKDTLYEIVVKRKLEKAKYAKSTESSLRKLPTLKSLRELMLSGELSDATLSVGGTDLPVHRAVLAAQSAYFKAAFQDKANKANVRVDFKDHYSLPLVQLLLRALYSGRVELGLEHSVEMLVAADRLGLPELRAKCEKFLADAIESAFSEQPGAMLCDVLRAAALLDCEPLRQVAVDHLRDNIAEVLASTAWDELYQGDRALAGAALIDATALCGTDVDHDDDDVTDNNAQDEAQMVEYKVKWNFRTAEAKFTLHHDICFNRLSDDITLPPIHCPDLPEIDWVIKIRPEKPILRDGDKKPGYRLLNVYLLSDNARCVDEATIIGRVYISVEQLFGDSLLFGPEYCEAYKEDLTIESFGKAHNAISMKYQCSKDYRFAKVAYMDKVGNELYIRAKIQYCFDDESRILFENVTKEVPRKAKPLQVPSLSEIPPNTLPVLRDLQALLSTGELSDATLCVGGTDLPVHRAVLAAQSAYFKAAFQAKAGKAHVRLDFKDYYSLPVVKRLLRALYSGQVELHLDDAVEMLVVTDKLGVPELRTNCEKFLADAMQARASTHPGAMLCDVLRAAALLDSEPLRRVAVDHLRDNLAEVVSTAWDELCQKDRPLAGAALADATARTRDPADHFLQ